jgi:hypothetical protein
MKLPLFVQLALLSFISCFTANAQSLCDHQGKWSICDSLDKEISARYDTILEVPVRNANMEISGSFFLGFEGGKISRPVLKIDSTYTVDENEVPIYSRITYTGLVMSGGHYDMLDGRGKIMMKGLEEVMLPVEWRDGITGYFNIKDTVSAGYTGDVIVAPVNSLQVRKNGKWGILDATGKEVLPFKFSSIMEQTFDDGKTVLQTMLDGKAGLYNSDGSNILPEKYTFISVPIIPESWNIEMGPLPLSDVVVFVKQGNKTGVAGLNGKELLPPVYDMVSMYSNDIFIVNKGGRFKVINYTDTFPEVYDGEGPVIQAVNDSVIEGGKFGVVNRDNKVLVPVSYDYIEVLALDTINYFECYTGGAQVKYPGFTYDRYYSPEGVYHYTYYTQNSKRTGATKTLHDLSGKEMFKGYEQVSAFSQIIYTSANDYYTFSYFITKMKGKQGVCIPGKKCIIPNKYDSIAPVSHNNGTELEFTVSKSGKWGVLSRKGKTIIPVKYDDLVVYDELIRYNIGGKRVYKPISVYDELGEVLEDSTSSVVGGKFGFIDWTGKVLPGEYDSIAAPAAYYNYDLYNSQDKTKRLFVVKANGKYGMVSVLGKTTIPVKYDKLEAFTDRGLLPAMLAGKWGLLDSTGKEVFAVKYDEIPYISYEIDNAYVVVMNKKRGMLDAKGQEIIPCVYDKFESGYPHGTAKGIFAVIKENKIGVFDSRTRKEIIAPMYDYIFPSLQHDSLLAVNIGAVDTDPNVYDNGKYKGGKWGAMTKYGRMVIPVEYDLIALFNMEAGLLKAGNGIQKDKDGMITAGSWDYYTEDGKKAADGEKKWNATYAGKMALAQKPFDLSPAWLSANGPEGADATAFYIDKKGTYWLGTGSSGGVYVSSDAGATWKERNTGIGPVHVQLMNAIHDTVFIKAAGAGYEEPVERSDNFIAEWEKVYYYDNASSRWVRVDSSLAQGVTDTLNVLAKANTEKMEAEFPMTRAELNVQRYFTGFEVYEADQLWNYSGFTKTIKDSSYLFSKAFPKDVFWLRNGNLYKAQNNIILLGKSGVFRYNGSQRIDRLGEKQLIASDVTQLFQLPGGSYIAKTGLADIWHYDGKAWKKLLDAYKENLNSNNSWAGYHTGWINMEPDGKAIFAMAGNLYEMDKTGKRELLLKTRIMVDSTVRVMPLAAVRSASDKNILHGLALMRPASDDPASYSRYGTEYFFYEFTYSTSSKKLAIGDTALATQQYYDVPPVLFKDKKGNTWLCMESSIVPIGDRSLKGLNNLNYMRPQTVALGNNGEIAIAESTDGLCIYDPAKKEWIHIRTPHRGSIDKLGYDNEGNLYAGCNYEFEYYCGGKGKLDDPGLYRLVFTAAGPEWKKLARGVNDRILSIAPHPKGLAIGTSGSGLYILDMGSKQASK